MSRLILGHDRSPPGVEPRRGPPTAAHRATAPALTWQCTTARWCGWWRTARRNGCPATSSRRTSSSPGSSGCSRPSTGSTPIAAHVSRATPSPASAGRSSTSCAPRTGSLAPSACASVRPSASVQSSPCACGGPRPNARSPMFLACPRPSWAPPRRPRCSASSSCARAAAAPCSTPSRAPSPIRRPSIRSRRPRRLLWCAVAQLGDRDRLVLRLYYLEDRTLAEIGRMLGVTESRVSQLHGRLVARLRARLAELSR